MAICSGEGVVVGGAMHGNEQPVAVILLVDPMTADAETQQVLNDMWR